MMRLNGEECRKTVMIGLNGPSNVQFQMSLHANCLGNGESLSVSEYVDRPGKN